MNSGRYFCVLLRSHPLYRATDNFWVYFSNKAVCHKISLSVGYFPFTKRTPLKLIGVECTGTYGSGLLRYLQNAGLEVLEVTAPDWMERRKRGKSDTIDAECAAHAAFSGIRIVTPKTRNGMIESLRVLKTCRKTAISARRVALQIIHSNIISAPDELREQLRNMTRMQLIRTLGSWDPGGLMPVNTAMLTTFIAFQ